MTFEERAAYLHQLKEEARLNQDDPRERLLAELAEAVALVCHQVYSLSEVNDGLNESVAILEEQMAVLFEDPEPEEGMGTDDYFEDGETPLYQVKCPDCGDQFAVDEQSLVKGFSCPSCGTHLVQA